MNVNSIGIDAIEIERFRAALKDQARAFWKRTFSPRELAYCHSYKDAAPHLAACFAAKEAVIKAMGCIGVPYSQIEVRHEKSGKPYVSIEGRRSRRIILSITHDHTRAFAVALALNG